MRDRLRQLFARLWPLLVLLAITAATAQIQFLGGQLLQRKIELGRWARPVMRLLRAMRRVRGGALSL